MQYLLTGSRVYGVATSKSDLDIVLLKKDADAFLVDLVKHNILITRTEAQNNYSDGGFYFDLFGIEVNVIIAQDEVVLEQWETTTRYMLSIAPIEDKEERITTFREYYHAHSLG